MSEKLLEMLGDRGKSSQVVKMALTKLAEQNPEAAREWANEYLQDKE